MEGFEKYQKIRDFIRATGNCCPLWVRTLICLWGTMSPWFLGWMLVQCSPHFQDTGRVGFQSVNPRALFAWPQ